MNKFASLFFLIISCSFLFSQTNNGAVEVIEIDPIFKTPKKTLPYDRDFILKVEYSEPIDVEGFCIYQVNQRYIDDLHERVYSANRFTNRHKVVKSDDGKKWFVYLYIPPLRPSRDYEFMLLTKRSAATTKKDVELLLKQYEKLLTDTVSKDNSFTQTLAVGFNNNNGNESFIPINTTGSANTANIFKNADNSYSKQITTKGDNDTSTANRNGTKSEIDKTIIYSIDQLYPKWKAVEHARFSFAPRGYIRKVNTRAYYTIEVGNELRYKPTGTSPSEMQFELGRGEALNAYNASEKYLEELSSTRKRITDDGNKRDKILDGMLVTCMENISFLQKERLYAELKTMLDTMCKKGWREDDCIQQKECCKEGKCETCVESKVCTHKTSLTCCMGNGQLCKLFSSIVGEGNYCELSYYLDSLEKRDAELVEKIRGVVAEYILNINFVTGSTNVLDLETRNKISISPDFGWVFYGMPKYNFSNGFNGLAGYGGVQFEFRYTDKNLPFWKLRNKTVWHFLSASIGLTYTPIGKDKRREDLIANKTSLLTGFGIRLSNIVRLTAGCIWFYRKDVNPTLDKKYLTATPFVGLSLDISVRAFFNEFLQIGAIVKDLRKPTSYSSTTDNSINTQTTR